MLAGSARAITPWYYQSFVAGGAPNTNIFTITAWPPVDNGFTTYGTNIIWGNFVQTNVPNAAGFVSNSIYANMYRVFYPDLGVGFFVNILDTTNYLSLAMYVVGAPVIPGQPADGYSIVTNFLRYGPATNSYAGVSAALGFFPATNTQGGVLYLLGYTPTTNSYTGVVFALGFAPATNSYVGVSNAVGFVIATNGGPLARAQMPADYATNSDPRIALAITNLTGDMYTAAQVGGTATVTLSNTVTAGTSTKVTYDSKGRVTGTSVLLMTDLPALSFIGKSNAPASYLVTNGWQVWVSYATNGPPGPAWTNLPWGSFMTLSNTSSSHPYWLSNSAGVGVWMWP